MQCYISVSFSPCYRYHLITILRIYKDTQCWYAYSFTIFQRRSYCHDIFSHYDLLLWSALISVKLWWLSSAPNCVAHFYSNLYELTIFSASKHVSILPPFSDLGFSEGSLSSFSSSPLWLVDVYFTSLLEQYSPLYLLLFSSVRFWAM